MNSRTPVVNISGDFEESIERFAKHLGKANVRRKVFNVIYGRKRRPLSKKQIMLSADIPDDKSQQTQDALEHLYKHHLVTRIENNGAVKDGSRYLYSKDETVRANRDRIIRYADDPSLAKRMPTKRRPSKTEPAALTFAKPKESRRSVTRTRRSSTKDNVGKKLRIAFLASNPNDEGKLRTDIELKAVTQAIQLSGRRSSVSLRPYPAASFGDLLDALNEFEPHIVHFSGHGGGEGLVFDTEYQLSYEGCDLDFDTIGKVIDAIDQAPRLIVFNACDTVTGAERFLGPVEAVVAMADSIADEAALLFAPRFYAALVAGQSLKSALAQGTAILDAQGVIGSELPRLLCAPGIEAAKLRLL